MALLVFHTSPFSVPPGKPGWLQSHRKSQKTLEENVWNCRLVMLQKHWKNPDFLLLGTSRMCSMIKQSRTEKSHFGYSPSIWLGKSQLKGCDSFKGQGGRERSCKERSIEAISPGSLLGDFSLSPWIHTRDGWGTHREVPVSWGLPCVSKEIEGKCSQTGSSLQVKEEVINQDCTASTHLTLAAKFGKASLDCCH